MEQQTGSNWGKEYIKADVDCDQPGFFVHGILQARILEWVAFSRGSSQPRDWPQDSHIAGRFLPSEPPGKPKNTGVGV